MIREPLQRPSAGWKLLVAAGVLGLFQAACGKENPASPPDPNAPVFTPLGSLGVSEVSRETFAVSAVDAEGDSIALSLVQGPDFAGFADHGDGTGTLVVAPELGDAAPYVLHLRASDGTSASIDTVFLTVAETPSVSGALFYESPGFCRSGDADTLLVWNEGSATLIWQPVSELPGAGNLLDRLEVPPGNIYGVILTWSPPGPFPVLDTLRVLTNDPLYPRVEIPLRAEAPGFVDILPPDVPRLRIPPDEAVFVLDQGTMEADILVDWSEIDDCSGIALYQIQVSFTGSFNPPDVTFRIEPASPGDAPPSEALLIAEAGDVGVAFWRVVARDTNGLIGVASAVRSWTVLAPPGQ